VKNGKIYHFDFYRLNSLDELEEIGYKDYFYSNEIVIVEWINLIPEVLDKINWIIKFKIINENKRELRLVQGS
jgi:tRNA threonylcarbamoyladenosine biosynthesis protein TsaE